MVNMESYLKCLGPPNEEFLCGSSLKSGVIVIGIIDIVFGVFRIFKIPPVFEWFIYAPFIGSLIILANLIDIGVAVFAMIGLSGISNLDEVRLRIYSIVKTVYIFVRISLYFLILLILMIYYAEYLDTDDKFYTTIVFFLAIAYNIPAGKLVWSTYMRVVNNEHLLVLYGKATVMLLQNRDYSYSNVPQLYATPGMAIAEPAERTPGN